MEFLYEYKKNANHLIMKVFKNLIKENFLYSFLHKIINFLNYH